jgi:hypothetical protein
MPAALLKAIHRRVAEINRSARDGQFTECRAMLPRHARRPFWGVSVIAAGQSNALKSNPRAFEFRLFLKNRANRPFFLFTGSATIWAPLLYSRSLAFGQVRRLGVGPTVVSPAAISQLQALFLVPVLESSPFCNSQKCVHAMCVFGSTKIVEHYGHRPTS